MKGLTRLWQKLKKTEGRNEFGGRTLAIGDIHGCLAAFDELLSFVKISENDIVVTLGDYIDRGNDSRGVVDRLLKLKDECHLVPLMGNHEVMMLQHLDGVLPAELWLGCGGSETVASYGGDPANIPQEHIDFLCQCLPWHETDTHIFVHANYDPHRSMEDQPEQTRLWDHLSFKVPPAHESGKIVIVGHTPQPSGMVFNGGHLLCIDTFCFGRGCLTALDVDTGNIWQVNKYGVRCQP